MKRLAGIFLSALLTLGCNQGPVRRQKVSVFVGIDVSGSFYNSPYYQEALGFLAHYLYGHLHGVGELKPLKTLFVGSIGGNTTDEAKSFHPIQDFEGKSVEQIRADLDHWFPKSDAFTDFNVFFKQVSMIAQKRNLSLSPIEVVLLSDGIPDTVESKSQTKFESIDVSPLEYLSRNTTVRLLYANPVVCKKWETSFPRKRVRMWTVDNQVMQGWKNQLKPDLPIEQQEKFWAWLLDNVDYRVQPVKFHSTPPNK